MSEVNLFSVKVLFYRCRSRMRLYISDVIKSNIMNQLESTKKINRLKASAIKNGGYQKHRDQILFACNVHLIKYNQNLIPKQFLS